ncbi:MAG: hypothetical protein RL760_1298, partial [Candidatus Eisenbacteria bacterium]
MPSEFPDVTQRADLQVDGGADDDLARALGTLDAVALAHVVGPCPPVAVVVAHGHPLPAQAAHHEALEKGGALAGRGSRSLWVAGGGVRA